jgi:hypothetical protein
MSGERYEEMYNLYCFTPDSGECLAQEAQTLISTIISPKPAINCFGFYSENLVILILQILGVQIYVYEAFSDNEKPPENSILCLFFGNKTIASVISYDTNLPFIPICQKS